MFSLSSSDDSLELSAKIALNKSIEGLSYKKKRGKKKSNINIIF